MSFNSSYAGSIDLNVQSTLTNSLADGVGLKDPIARDVKNTYNNGTGSGNAQIHFHTQRTLATNTNETLDLTALTGLGGAPGTFTFTKVKAILFECTTATTGYKAQVGAAASNAFIGPVEFATDVVQVGAGGRWLQESPVDGWAVTSTCKCLMVNNPAGGSLTYRITIIGEGSIN
jgi:hypothetical protein